MLRSLTVKFYYIMVSMEESKKLHEMKLEELQALLEAHEMRLKQMRSKRKKMVEHTLQAMFIKKDGKGKEKQRKNHATAENSSKNSKNQNYPIKNGMSNKNPRKKVNMKEM